MEIVAASSFYQDLAAPMSQVLQSTPQGGTTTNYLYGLLRLAAVNGTTKNWYVSDALGSVRRTLSSAGVPGAPIGYDPWGQPQYGAVPAFGFTGELQDVNTGLVYLRARWYSSAKGTFTSRDPFAGLVEQPYSLHPYQYAYSDPIRLTDPSGYYAGADVGDQIDEAACRAMGWLWVRDLETDKGRCVAQPPRPQPNQPGMGERYQNGGQRDDGSQRYPPQPDPRRSTFPDFSTKNLNPPFPLPLPVPGAGGRSGGLAGKLRMCLLLALLSVPVVAPLAPSYPHEDKNNRDIAFRNPGEGQHPGALITGFAPKDPNSLSSIGAHVRQGSRIKTKYISLTRSLEVARREQNPDIPIYVIDLKKVNGTVIDLSIPAIREAMIPNDNIARNYAQSSEEVLVDGTIPPTAIVTTIDFMQPYTP